MSCVFKGTPGNICSTGRALMGSTVWVFTSNLREGGEETGAEREGGQMAPGVPLPEVADTHLQKRCRLKSSTFPPLRGRAPVISVTSRPRPSLSRRLGPSTDAPVYTHTWLPGGEKSHIGLGAGSGHTLSLNVKRKNPERPFHARPASSLGAQGAEPTAG